MKEMDDTVEISGEGAAKAAGESNDTDEQSVDEQSIDEESLAEEPTDTNIEQGEVESVRNELNDTKNRLLRQAAEFQNYKRRTEQEKSLYVRTGKEQVIQPMLDIFDDFSRSINATKQAEEQNENLNPMYLKLREGVELVYEKFRNELNRLGVEPIEAVGKSFNENEHEALMQQPAPEDVEPGTVLEEIQTGYRMGDKILRHSRVIVAS
ncbi:MAG: nucleotide exchange factor GrpE [Rhodothermaceae bacterium]|nr:nucleotide exchange factor GrpE [Rhodothermaceae bacterium]